MRLISEAKTDQLQKPISEVCGTLAVSMKLSSEANVGVCGHLPRGRPWCGEHLCAHLPVYLEPKHNGCICNLIFILL